MMISCQGVLTRGWEFDKIMGSTNLIKRGMRMAIGAKVKRARGAGVPLLAVSSADQGAVVAEVAAGINGAGAVISWDCIRGWVALNPPAQSVISELGRDPAEVTGPFVESLRAALMYLPEGGTLFCLNAHLALRDGNGPNLGSVQAVSNLREPFKANSRVLVLLAPSWDLGAELRESVIILDDDLPDRATLAGIIGTICESAGVVAPEGDAFEVAVDSISGLSAFSAEQAVALSITGKGLSQSLLWARKEKQIEQTAGLRVMPANVNYSLVGGCDGFKRELRAIMTGPKAPRLVVFIDEIEKAMGGASGGSLDGGVSSDQLGVLLSSMSENEWTGILLVGPPGASKTWLANSLPGEFGVQGIAFDLGSCKGSLVGESEQKIRAAVRTLEAIGGSRVLFIATSNKISSLKPELRRRFSLGTWFADLCDPIEREAVLRISMARFGHEVQGVAELVARTEGWSAANLKDLCFVSMMKGCAPAESFSSVIPAARMDPAGLDELRREAAGRYNSVSTGAVYSMVVGAAPTVVGRRVQVGGE